MASLERATVAGLQLGTGGKRGWLTIRSCWQVHRAGVSHVLKFSHWYALRSVDAWDG